MGLLERLVDIFYWFLLVIKRELSMISEMGTFKEQGVMDTEFSDVLPSPFRAECF
jgi:hypothetical protein